ncbi:acyl-CoA carboxylase epsilon subunit [Egicoccus sp. AB-alg2]|uniref:acyl-CoA carboxylase epsilon subunit n=1 Tax=Egicoccus sp. AB-alg2 TaxID=3242693 RepID=UPI00359DC5DF
MDTRIEVLHGAPSPEELAALVVALTPVASTPAADEAPGGEGRQVRVPAWTRAALLEGVGGSLAVRPTDLARHPS